MLIASHSYLFITASPLGNPSSNSCVGRGWVSAHKRERIRISLKSPPFWLFINSDQVVPKECNWLRVSSIALRLYPLWTRNSEIWQLFTWDDQEGHSVSLGVGSGKPLFQCFTLTSKVNKSKIKNKKIFFKSAWMYLLKTSIQKFSSGHPWLFKQFK